jgi:hypothetical protein
MQHRKSSAFNRADVSEQTKAAAVSARNVGNREQHSEAERDVLATRLEQGTPPSNTVPPNYTGNPDHTKILRYGIDSLYLSFSGSLDNKLEEKLVTLKLAAQSTDDLEKASAQLKIGEHLFEVLGRGARRFPFVLNNNLFQIQLSH